ncbi:MAG TPA: HYR domain-containing protein, partial [Blastocatellia bacterium]|nr:HYR domain-containing protein [Blastocatellia bacterium]
PAISVSPNAVTFTQGQSVVLPTPTVSDAVDTSVTVTNNAPATYPVGNTVVTFTATDDNGNSATATVTVTINSAGGNPSITSITPTTAKRGQTISMTIVGTGFVDGADVTFAGGGIIVSNVNVTSTQITLTVKLSQTSTPSNRTVTVTNPNGMSSSLPQAFQVK